MFKKLKIGRSDAPVSFFNVNYWYIIIFALVGTFAFITSQIFELGSNTILITGTWFVLGGFSIWYPMSAFMLIPAIIMLIYTIFSMRIINISKNSKEIVVEENIFVKSVKKSVKIDEIQTIRIIRGYLGPKMVWIVIFLIHMLYILTNGIMILSNPETFGWGITQSIFYIISGIVDFAVILLIVIRGEDLIEIRTKDHLFRMVASIPKKQFGVLKSDILGISNESSASKRAMATETGYRKNQAYSLIKILCGLIFITIAIISRAANMFAGTALRLIFYIFGAIEIIGALKESYIVENGYQQGVLKQYDDLQYSLVRFALGETIFIANNMLVDLPKETYKYQKPNVFQICLMFVLPFFLGWTFMIWFRFLPSTSVPIIYSVLNVLFTIVAALTLIITVFMKSRQISTKVDDEKFGMIYPHSQAISKTNERNQKKIAREQMIREIGISFVFVVGLIVAFL